MCDDQTSNDQAKEDQDVTEATVGNAQVEALQAELQAANEKTLRYAADIQNLRRRTEQEKKDAANFAITKFATDLISVADSFALALTSIPSEVAESPNGAAVLQGIEMVQGQLVRAFEKHGLCEIKLDEDRSFDPNKHDAVQVVAASDQAEDTVVSVLRAGYTLNDRVIRPAMVSVAGPA